ncbi:unnamed protein product [Polarella glacialis]|uniref:Uncharacterized protein n=1 Tax=Polarella glacialis TaxID=89957 RepID=A0A813K7Q9_POLGL|nr:unnamed protein product [Polarella glacialis]
MEGEVDQSESEVLRFIKPPSPSGCESLRTAAQPSCSESRTREKSWRASLTHWLRLPKKLALAHQHQGEAPRCFALRWGGALPAAQGRALDFPTRAGELPVTHDQCLHRMLTQQLPLHGSSVSVTQHSRVSMATTAPCFVLSKSVPLPGGLVDSHHVREFARIHAECNLEWGWTS